MIRMMHQHIIWEEIPMSFQGGKSFKCLMNFCFSQQVDSFRIRYLYLFEIFNFGSKATIALLYQLYMSINFLSNS